MSCSSCKRCLFCGDVGRVCMFLVVLLFCRCGSGYRYKSIEHSSSSSSINTCTRVVPLMRGSFPQYPFIMPQRKHLKNVHRLAASTNPHGLRVVSTRGRFQRGRLSALCGSEYTSTDRRSTELWRNISSKCLLSSKVINAVFTRNPAMKSMQKTS